MNPIIFSDLQKQWDSVELENKPRFLKQILASGIHSVDCATWLFSQPAPSPSQSWKDLLITWLDNIPSSAEEGAAAGDTADRLFVNKVRDVIEQLNLFTSGQTSANQSSKLTATVESTSLSENEIQSIIQFLKQNKTNARWGSTTKFSGDPKLLAPWENTRFRQAMEGINQLPRDKDVISIGSAGADIEYMMKNKMGFKGEFVCVEPEPSETPLMKPSYADVSQIDPQSVPLGSTLMILWPFDRPDEEGNNYDWRAIERLKDRVDTILITCDGDGVTCTAGGEILRDCLGTMPPVTSSFAGKQPKHASVLADFRVAYSRIAVYNKSSTTPQVFVLRRNFDGIPNIQLTSFEGYARDTNLEFYAVNGKPLPPTCNEFIYSE